MDSLTGIILAFGIPAAGLTYLWYLKWSKKDDIDTLSTFFLAGGRVGGPKTGYNNWGLCFAFANAVWYFAFLGYYYGPLAFLLQLPWTVAIFLIARWAARYIAASGAGTVHGFIGYRYGVAASVIAAGATLIGYTLNCGFELFYSAHLLAVAFSLQQVELLLAIGIAIFVGAYCMAGGYMASVKTEAHQNWLGVIALITLIAALSGPHLAQQGTLNAFESNAQFNVPPWHFVVGISVFAFFFNFVDMANWQSLAANRNLEASDLKNVSRDLRISAMVQLFAPAFLGVWLGVLLKGLDPALADDTYFRFAFSQAFPAITLVYGIALGVVVLGFVAVTISSADSYILAALQTLVADVFKRKQYARYLDEDTPQDERNAIEHSILALVKQSVIPVAIIMTSAFAGLYYLLTAIDAQGVAFQFQFVMYGAAVTLCPAVISGLRKGISAAAAEKSNSAATWSIVLGLLAVILPFVFATVFWQTPAVTGLRGGWPEWFSSDLLVNLTPVFGLVVSSFVFFVFGGHAK